MHWCVSSFCWRIPDLSVGTSYQPTGVGKRFSFSYFLEVPGIPFNFSKPALDTSSLPDSVVREFCFLIRIQRRGCSFHLMSSRKI